MMNNIKSVYEQLCAIPRPTVMQNSMKNMIRALLAHEIKAYADAGNQVILFDYPSGMLRLMVECDFRDKSDSVIMHTAFPIVCCEENRREMEQLLHMINYGTVQTPFEYDPRDGECRIKAAHYCGDTPLSVKQADHMIWLILAMLHQYRDTLVPVILGIEPDYRKTCSEYNEMKLRAMDVVKEEQDEPNTEESESKRTDEELSSEEDELTEETESVPEDASAQETTSGEAEVAEQEDNDVYDMMLRMLSESADASEETADEDEIEESDDE